MSQVNFGQCARIGVRFGLLYSSVGAGEAGDTVGAEGASKPETANSSLDWTVKLASFGPDTMGCVSLGLGPIRELGGEREKLLIL